MNKKELLNIPFVAKEKIANICTYKTSGNVKGVFYPENERQLIMIYQYLKDIELPFKIIGNGSNLLIKDNCDYLFICTKKMQDKIIIKDEDVYISTSVNISKAFKLCCQKGLSGFEKLAGIPATIGGALKMNASAYNNSILDHLEKIKVYKDGKIKYIKKEDFLYSYHKTNLNDCLILSAKFKLVKANSCQILSQYSKYIKLRGDKQPRGFSCGSVFKNPQNYSAGRLVEQCMLKGTSRGDAQISNKHANFIININNAKFEDVKELIELCQEEVNKRYNINLEPEVEIIE